jgi:hypothetical protein
MHSSSRQGKTFDVTDEVNGDNGSFSVKTVLLRWVTFLVLLRDLLKSYDSGSPSPLPNLLLRKSPILGRRIESPVRF